MAVAYEIKHANVTQMSSALVIVEQSCDLGCCEVLSLQCIVYSSGGNLMLAAERGWSGVVCPWPQDVIR